MRHARHTYITFSPEVASRIIPTVRKVRNTLIEIHNFEVYSSLHFLVFDGLHAKPTTHVFHDELDQYFSGKQQLKIRNELGRPVQSLNNEWESEVFDRENLQLINIAIPISSDRETFILTKPRHKTLAFASINLVVQKNTKFSVDVFQHYMEIEVRQEYHKVISEALIEASNKAENSVEYSDPSDLYIIYMTYLNFVIPDINIVFWKWVQGSKYLQCDASTDVEFDFDVLDADCRIHEVFGETNSFKVVNIKKECGHEGSSSSLFAACYDRGWKSATFRALKTGNRINGAIGFFSRYRGEIPSMYNFFTEIFSQQTTRFITERGMMDELFLLKNNLKRLVPLMALGSEVLNRNHDIRDQITLVRSLLISVRDKADLVTSKETTETLEALVMKQSRKASQALEAVEHMQSVLSKQLQTFRNARETRRNLNVNDLIAGVIRRLEVLSGIENVELTCNINLVGVIRGQQFYLERVFENVIGNAIYFAKQSMGENKVEVTSHLEESYISINISDTGPGIIQEPIDLIYELGETTKPDGFGVGLSIVKQIVEEHRGKILVEKRKSGGTKFQILLPYSTN